MSKQATPFPKRFLWGAATSAHQVEGGTHNQWSVWELDHAKVRAAQAEHHMHDLAIWPEIEEVAKTPDTYVSSSASQHYEHYEADFDYIKKLGLNAYRFSVEWSRIEPREGSWDAKEIAHYKQYVAALKVRDIEPMVTLFHFTLPVWFSKLGGFERRNNIKYFVRFAEKIMSEFGGDVKYIVTINEPEVYAYNSYLEGSWPPGVSSKRQFFAVLNNLIRAHNKAAKVLHGMNRRYKVSIAKNSPFDYPGDDAFLSRASAGFLQYLHDDYILKRVRKTCDFIGVNYYFSNRVYGYRVHNPHTQQSDMGWDLAPENIEYVLERLYRKYKLPLIVTENGLADMHDEKRKWWLGKTMLAMQNAIVEGVDLQGYFHWSLLDNFEWASGTWPRFGLVEVDYTSGKRTIRPSALWWAALRIRMRGK